MKRTGHGGKHPWVAAFLAAAASLGGAQETKEEPQARLKEADVKALGQKLGKYVEAQVIFDTETKADPKVKAGKVRRGAFEALRKAVEDLEKRNKFNFLKSTADLRSVIEASFDFTGAKTRPGDFFADQFKEPIEGGRKHRIHKYGYYLPKKYQAEKKRAFPLIISLPVKREDTGAWVNAPSHLRNVYGGSAFLEDYLVFCPELPADFQAAGSPASAEALFTWLDVLIYPLSQFLLQHHVDWNRIYLEAGRESTRLALFFASVAPRYFAGLIVRDPGEMLGCSLQNFHSLPTYLLASEKTKGNAEAFLKGLESLGYKNSTLVEGKEFPFSDLMPQVVEWVARQRRNPAPARLVFRPLFSDFGDHWWVLITQFTTLVEDAKKEEQRPLIEVEADRAGNRIQVKARGIKSFNLLLCDDLVDLDKPVTLVVNGSAEERQVERNLELAVLPALTNDPQFIYTYRMVNIQVPREEPAGEAKPSAEDGGGGQGGK